MRIRKRQFTVMLGVAFAAALFLGGVANATSWVTPVIGTPWDFTVSGAKLGSGAITFWDDNTITGYVLVIPASTKNGQAGQAVSYGFFDLEGEWEFNQSGQIVGFMNNDPSETVRLDIDNFSGSVSSNGQSQSFKFTGQTVDGSLTFNGAPIQMQTNPPSLWTINKIMQGAVTFTEIYNTWQDVEYGGYNNLYDFSGVGADICIWGMGAISRGNSSSANFGIEIVEYPMPTSGGCESITPTFALAGSGRVARKTALAVAGGAGLNPNPPPATGIGSAAIGKIKFQGVDGGGNATTSTATSAGYQEGSPPTKVTIPVFCQE